jgi:two-component system sensor histidine kinase YesM
MKKSSIAGKIVTRITIIGLFTYLAILLASYLTLLPPLKNRSITVAQNVNSQIIQQTDYMLSDIQQYAESIASSEGFESAFVNYINNSRSEKYYKMVCISLNKLASQRSNIRSIIAATEDGKIINSITKINKFDLNLLHSQWYKTLRATDYASSFSGVYHFKEDAIDIYSAAYCKNFYLYNQRLTITIFFEINKILALTKSLALKNFDNYLWLDSSRRPFYSSGSTIWAQKIIPKLTVDTIYKSKPFNGLGGYNLVGVSEQSRWIMVSFVSNRSLFVTFRNYFFTVILLFVLLYSLSILMITPMITKIIQPVSSLAAVMAEASKGNLDIVSDIETDDEIGELSQIFNRMLSDIKDYIRKLLEKEALEQHMKYSLLISQIDPHFICNTMNMINFLARQGRGQDIIATNTALMNILQDRLRISHIEIMDTVQQEVNIVKQYLLILNFRFGDNVEVIWDIDESLAQVQIPKNIIQPLMENAFFHGLADEEGGSMTGLIKISIQGNENRIMIKVCDNGRGIEPEKLEQLNSFVRSHIPDDRGKHIGIANVRERLLYLYGNQDCILIESTPSQGTCVILTLELSRGAAAN